MYSSSTMTFENHWTRGNPTLPFLSALGVGLFWTTLLSALVASQAKMPKNTLQTVLLQLPGNKMVGLIIEVTYEAVPIHQYPFSSTTPAPRRHIHSAVMKIFPEHGAFLAQLRCVREELIEQQQLSILMSDGGPSAE